MAYTDHFSLANLPYGIASCKEHPEKAVATRLHDLVIFLADLPLECAENVKSALTKPTLNDLAAASKSELQQLRGSLKKALEDDSLIKKFGYTVSNVSLHLPISVAGFFDFSCSKDHVQNMEEAIFGKKGMPPSFLHYPVGYTGTSSSIVVSGTKVQRPLGVSMAGGSVSFGPTKAMDYELELAAIIGKPTNLGDSVALEDADDHIFGLVLLNDWSARDIQGFEMKPLGPMNGKSFCTSISPWVVPLEALEPFETVAPAKELAVSSFLSETKEKPSYDIQLEAELVRGEKSTTICKSNVSWMYWTFRDLVAQHTVNGCNLNTGDLLATGTVSGAGDDAHGCLAEMTKGGKVQIELADGSQTTYLQDGDGIRMTAYCGKGVGFGDCTGFITPSRSV
ncbi:fumarylacetoacetate hydrolase FahA [Apiospora kogelbergensis]|uniref:Fumarylacetoacetase n=1 Tax=Apiospora kogelbergensis TaxID=1337665 RepID=A0AAW0QM36_9PEZI